MEKIYLDHNASTPCSPLVVEQMTPFFTDVFSNASSIHQGGQKARKAIEEARVTMARFINAASPDEIIFISGGTESNNHAIHGAFETKRTSDRRMISSAIEHSAVRNVLRHLDTVGKIDFVSAPVLPNGILDMTAFKEALTTDTILASVMVANNEVGTIQPITEIAALCHSKNILFHTDAVQAAGKISIDVQTWDVDMLSLSAHKFGGPKGAGILYVRKGTRMSPLIIGGRQEKNRRGGTENVAALVGMAAAATQVMNTFKEHTTHLAQLRDELETSILKIIPLTQLNGDPEKRVCNTSNICFEYTDSTELLMALDLKGVSCSNGSACHAGSPEASHVLLAMGLPQEKAHASLRFSVGATNTHDEIVQAVKIIQDTVGRLREKHPLWRKSA